MSNDILKKKLAQETYNQRMDEMHNQNSSNIIKIKSNVTSKLNRQFLLDEYELLKNKYNTIDTDETLKKYRILSKAYKIGKKIYGIHYSISAMAIHFDIPYETCRRIMSLERANKKMWSLIKEGKLSAFKAAQICLTINENVRDKIVDAVVKDNLSTYQIKRLDRPNKGQVNEERLKISIERGFSTQDAAYRSIRDTVKRMNHLLDLKKENFSERRLPEIITMLEELKYLIDTKIKELSGDNGI